MSAFSFCPLVDFEDLNFHALMLRNESKYAAFCEALRPIVKGRVVAEIGAGVGIISLIAAELGARKVLAIEQSPVPIQVMKELVREYPKSGGRISILEGSHSDFLHDLVTADVVFSETIGYFGLEEGLSVILSDVRARSDPSNRPLLLPIGMLVEFHPLNVLGRDHHKALYLSTEPVPSLEATQLTPPLNFEPLYNFGTIPELRSVWRLKADEVIYGFSCSFVCKLSSSISITNRTEGWPRATVKFPTPLVLKKESILQIGLNISKGGLLSIDYGDEDRRESLHIAARDAAMISIQNGAATPTSIRRRAHKVIDTILGRT